VQALEGPFAARVVNYASIFGSLSIDITAAIVTLIIFGICAGSETAITTLWPWKVRELAQREDGQRGMWKALRHDLQRFLQTILIGATISGVMSTAIITQICGQLFGPKGLGIATASATVGQLVFCEIIPKSVAVSHPYLFANAALPTFYVISYFLYPISKIVNRFVELLLRCVRISVDASKTPFVSEQELDLIFQSAMRTGVVEPEEGEMIRSVRNLDNQKVKDVMTPLVDIVGIEAMEPISQLHRLCLDTQHSRVPVYSKRFDSIVGVVSTKALLRHVSSFGDVGEELKVEEIMDKPFFVPETMSCLNLLQQLKERTLAICVDEYGGTTGLATLEDVLEEIVGDIYDPDDRQDKRERTKSRSAIDDLGNGLYTMSGAADLTDVSEGLGLELPEGDYNSIGGFLCDIIDGIPSAGEAVIVSTAREAVRFEVTEVDERKIVRIDAQRQRLGMEGDADSADGTEKRNENDEEADRVRVLDVRVEERSEEQDDAVTEKRPID